MAVEDKPTANPKPTPKPTMESDPKPTVKFSGNVEKPLPEQKNINRVQPKFIKGVMRGRPKDMKYTRVKNY